MNETSLGPRDETSNHKPHRRTIIASIFRVIRNQADGIDLCIFDLNITQEDEYERQWHPMNDEKNPWLGVENTPIGVFPDDLNENLRHFLDYWTSKKPSSGELPKRSDISPRDMIDYLPGIVIIERRIENNKVRYKYRLAGTLTATVSNIEITGRYVDEIFDEDVIKGAEVLFKNVLETGTPHYLERTNPIPNRDFTKYERVIVPLLDSRGEPNLIMGLWEWTWA